MKSWIERLQPTDTAAAVTASARNAVRTQLDAERSLGSAELEFAELRRLLKDVAPSADRPGK